eukprot:s699_g31.t1
MALTGVICHLAALGWGLWVCCRRTERCPFEPSTRVTAGRAWAWKQMRQRMPSPDSYDPNMPAFPPLPPTILPNDVPGPSPWAHLEFEAGGIPDTLGNDAKPVEKRQNATGLSTVFQMANHTASKAKEKISSLVQMWSPRKKRPLDPTLDRRLPIVSGGNRIKGKKNKSSNILAIARRVSGGKNATDELERDFASNTSRKAKQAIRKTVMSVFKESKGIEPLPPSVEKIKLLGGILKAAKYRAAANYLSEYKLLAIEAGHQWPAQFERTLKLTKRSATRALGPQKKAAEVETKEVGDSFATRRSMATPRKVPLAGELFDFGVTWMLREVELAAVTKDHIHLEFGTKRVRLTLPVSKGDQEGTVVKRVLQCVCEQQVCDISCPFYVSVRLVDRMVALDMEEACVTHRGKLATKAQLVADWKVLFGDLVSGHSARRTGALRLIRRGWAIPQVAYLGRWKSSVIYSYAAEALETLPVNTGGAFQGQGSSGVASHTAVTKGPTHEELENIKNYLLAELDLAKADQKRATQALDAEVEAMKKRSAQNGDRLPPVVQAVASKVVHYNMDMANCSPPQAWKTLTVRSVLEAVLVDDWDDLLLETCEEDEHLEADGGPRVVSLGVRG